MYCVPDDLDLNRLVGAKCTAVSCCLHTLQLGYECQSNDESISIDVEHSAIIQIAGASESRYIEKPWTSGDVVRQLGCRIVSAKVAANESVEIVYDSGDRFVWVNGPSESIRIRIGTSNFIM